MSALSYCARCDHRHPSRGVPGAPLLDGSYSPSGFTVLSSGELECPSCEGSGILCQCPCCEGEGCDACDGQECGPCPECQRSEGELGSGSIPCDHSGQEPYSPELAPIAYRCARSGLQLGADGRCAQAPSHQQGRCRRVGESEEPDEH